MHAVLEQGHTAHKLRHLVVTIGALLATSLASVASFAHTKEPVNPASSRPELTGSATGQPDSTWSTLKKAGLEVRTFDQEGLADPAKTFTRRYLQYVPQGLKQHHNTHSRHKQGGKHPVVIVLHGANISAEFMRQFDAGDRFERLADRDRFILVYGNAVYAKGAMQDKAPDDPFFAHGGYWRTCLGAPGGPDRAVDDVAYLRRVIRQLKQEGLKVDDDRIYVVGVSNGGEMAQRAAREMGQELAGIGMVVPVLGLPAGEPLLDCAATAVQHPLSVAHIYSEKDPLLVWVWDTFFPPGVTYAQDMERSGRLWRAAIGADAHPFKSTPLPDKIQEGAAYAGTAPWALATRSNSVTRHEFMPAPNGAGYVLYVMDHAGHGWPRPEAKPIVDAEAFGFTNQDFHASDAIWNFLKTKSRIRQR